MTRKKSPQYVNKWKWMAPLGLTLIGMGVSIAGEGTLLKGDSAPWWQWVGMGTLGLVVLNSGIAVFGDAVKRRFWFEWEESRIHSEEQGNI